MLARDSSLDVFKAAEKSRGTSYGGGGVLELVSMGIMLQSGYQGRHGSGKHGQSHGAGVHAICGHDSVCDAVVIADGGDVRPRQDEMKDGC